MLRGTPADAASGLSGHSGGGLRVTLAEFSKMTVEKNRFGSFTLSRVRFSNRSPKNSTSRSFGNDDELLLAELTPSIGLVKN